MIFFYFLYASVFIAAILYPDYVLEPATSGTTSDLTLGPILYFLLLIATVWWFRKYRHLPIIGIIYNVIVLFFGVLLATLFVNYAKKSIKEWWKED